MEAVLNVDQLHQLENLIHVSRLEDRDIASAADLIDDCFPSSSRLRTVEDLEDTIVDRLQPSYFACIKNETDKVVSIGCWVREIWRRGEVEYKLGYICTSKKYRKLGCASLIISSLIDDILLRNLLRDDYTINLDCLTEKIKFYNRFGFEIDNLAYHLHHSSQVCMNLNFNKYKAYKNGNI